MSIFTIPRLLAGTDGDDTLIGNRREDIAIGKHGDDLIRTAQGDDILFGGKGNDILRGGAGDDFLSGGARDDQLFGGKGNDLIIGGAGEDTVFGGAGDDLIRGRTWDDRLFGGRGDDTVNGGTGSDTLAGGKGDDVLRGGGGDDAFRFNPSRSNEGDDKIADFQLGRDKIVLDVFQVLAATPGLAEAIIENGGTAAATLTALDDNPNWTLGTDDAGDLVVTHPNGTITLAGIPGEGISSFADVAAALTVEGLGEALTGLAEASGNPATVADIVAGSGGDPDNNNDDFDLLLTALEATGLTAALADPEANFSVFAPTDAAFISLAQRLGYNGDDEAEALTTILDALTELGGGDPIPLLTDVLLYHVAPDARTLGELQLDKTVSPLFDGADLTFDGLIIEDADPDFEDAEIIAADVQAGNAVVQVINEVLLPLDL